MTGAAELRIRQAELQDLPAWQEFVDRSEAAGPLHHAGWYHVLSEAFDVELHYLMATDREERVRGVLPLYLCRSRFTGRHVSSLDGGILTSDTQATALLLGGALALRDRLGSPYLQLRGGPIDDGSPGQTMQLVSPVIDLRQGAATLWQGLGKKTRNGVRRAAKEGYTASLESDLDRIDAFYRLYAQRLHELGTPVFGIGAMRSVAKHLGEERLRLILVKRGSDAVGGMVCIVNASRWTDYYAVVPYAALPGYANYLLYWTAIEAAAGAGASFFDLGRSSPGSGNHLFKQKWGGVDHEVCYSFFPSRSSRSQLGIRKSVRGPSVKQLVWSRLPLGVCNRLGPVLRRKLPFL